MSEPLYSIVYTAVVYGTDGAVAVGDAMLCNEAAGRWVRATLANRTALGAATEGFAITSFGGPGAGTVSVQCSGTLSAAVTGLGAGSVADVRVNDNARLERVTTASVDDDVIGRAQPSGRVQLAAGASTAKIIEVVSGGGGGGTPLPDRRTLEFVGDQGVTTTATDDAGANKTTITVKLSGVFRDPVNGGAYGEARSQWSGVRTSNATPAVTQSISIPAATFGDCRVTIITEYTACAAAGTGGNLAQKVTLKRISGALSVVHANDNGIAADLDAAVSMTVGVQNNDTIAITSTGLSSAVNWIGSTHIQLAKRPA